ncbi:MAG: hypothetical protein ACXVCY_06245 [Pseudobdellovibrionaceae bacterium]
MKINVLLSLLLLSISVLGNATERTDLYSWSGYYELANPTCKTGEMVLGDKIYYGKSLSIKVDLKYSTMRFEVLTENGLHGYDEDYKEINTGKYLYSDTCYSDGMVARSKLTITRALFSRNWEDLKPFAFCMGPYRVTNRSTQKIAMKDSQGNVFYYGCWFKKIEL